MAGKSSEHRRGEMDIQEQMSTFALFNNLTKWGSLFIGALVLFLSVWFCTSVGFPGAAFTAVVVVALGVIFLRQKPAAAH